MTPLNVMLPLVVSNVPPPAPSVTPLLALSVWLPLLTYVPLSKVKKLATAEAGAAPLLLSLFALGQRLPPVTTHFPLVKVELFAMGLKSAPPVIVTVLPVMFVIAEITESEPD